MTPIKPETPWQHALDVGKAACAVLLVQIAVLVLQDLLIYIPHWINFLSSTGAGVIAIKVLPTYKA